MKRMFFISVALCTTLVVGVTTPAAAQIRVDARIHTSAGSCASCDLSKRRMNGMMLQDADFSKSLFNNANLSGARFDRADLSEAHFKKALLLRVVGERVNLSNTDFQDATLTEAKLNNSNLKNSNFRRADLTRAIFDTSDFTQSDMRSATASDASFQNSNFTNARLDHVYFQNVDLREANFKNAQFGQAVLLGANLSGANFSGSDLRLTRGLIQAKLDVACGNSDTLLPSGLSIPYCKQEDMIVTTGHRNAEHGHLEPRMARAAKDLDEAIMRLEKVMARPSENIKKMRQDLEAIHSDIVASRKAIEFEQTYAVVPTP